MNTQSSPDSSSNDNNDTNGSSSTGSIKITRRTDKSLPMKFIHTILRPIRPRLVNPKSVAPEGSQQLTPHRKATRRCHIRERQVHGIWVYDITRKDASGGGAFEGDGTEAGEEKTRDKVRETARTGAPAWGTGRRKRIIYFAGGGWQMPPSSGHWALVADLVNRVPGTTVTLVSYPLAPKTPAASAMPKLRKMYDTLMHESIAGGDTAEHEKVILAGDSSGGNIAICLVTWALTHEPESSMPAPVAILAISPSTDLRHLNEKLKEIEKLDPLLTVPFIKSTAQAWSGKTSSENDTDDKKYEADLVTGRAGVEDQTAKDDTTWTSNDPRVSPILADLTPLVKRDVRLFCVTGTYDVLSTETHAFREKCQKAGVVGEWLEWERQMHCFPLACAYGLRESKEGVDWMVDVLCKV